MKNVILHALSVFITVSLRTVLAMSIVVMMAGAASSARLSYTVGGEGTNSCGSWTAKRLIQTAVAPEQWTLGFLSGIGAAGEFFNVHPLNRMSADVVWIWIDRYCDAHPLHDISKAGLMFGGQAAKGTNENALFLGYGTRSCGTWLAARRDRQSTAYEQWIIGFMSGIGAANTYLADGRFDPLARTDAQGVWAWIDNFCRANTVDKLSRAGQLLSLELDDGR